MNPKKAVTAFLIVVLIAVQRLPAADTYPALKDAVILIVRHGEKPDAGFDLSDVGKERAQKYVKYFTEYKIDGKPLKIDCVYASKNSGSSHRPLETVKPTADALGFKVRHEIDNKDFATLAGLLQTDPGGKAILVGWHHGKIPKILAKFGVDLHALLGGDVWPDNVFCWVIQMRFDKDGKLSDTKAINVGLMPCDSLFPVYDLKKKDNDD